MADLFVSTPGQVAAFEMSATLGQVAIPAEIKDPPFIRSRPSPVIFNTVDWMQKTNQQFVTSLDGSVYIYVFGDQMGSVSIQGYAFDQLCQQDISGLQMVLDYYDENRASKRQLPIKIAIGEKVIQGFLTGVKVLAIGSAGDPAPVLNRYELEINALP
jgi:hypothetical protein